MFLRKGLELGTSTEIYYNSKLYKYIHIYTQTHIYIHIVYIYIYMYTYIFSDKLQRKVTEAVDEDKMLKLRKRCVRLQVDKKYKDTSAAPQVC